MTFVCTFTHYVYGYSGNELPPPVERTEQYSYLSNENESLSDFKNRMQELGMIQRRKADSAPVERYSSPDGWSWIYSEIREIPE